MIHSLISPPDVVTIIIFVLNKIVNWTCSNKFSASL